VSKLSPLLWTHNIHFAISFLAASLDRERTSSYAFRVTARDGGGEEQTVQYTIQVLDENDNSPTFQAGSYYNTTVQEDHAVRMLLLAIFSAVIW